MLVLLVTAGLRSLLWVLIGVVGVAARRQSAGGLFGGVPGR
ncbi:hypothetical protein [Streptomyces sp. NPDC046805]